MGNLISGVFTSVGAMLMLSASVFVFLWLYSLKNTSIPVLGVNRISDTGRYKSGHNVSASSSKLRTHSASAQTTYLYNDNLVTSPSISRSRIVVTKGYSLIRSDKKQTDVTKENKGSSCPTPLTQTYLKQKLNQL